MTTARTISKLKVPPYVLTAIEAALEVIDDGQGFGAPSYRDRYLSIGPNGELHFDPGGEVILVEEPEAPTGQYYFFAFVKDGKRGNALAAESSVAEIYHKCQMEGSVLLTWKEITKYEYESIIHYEIKTSEDENPEDEYDNDQGTIVQGEFDLY